MGKRAGLFVGGDEDRFEIHFVWLRQPELERVAKAIESRIIKEGVPVMTATATPKAAMEAKMRASEKEPTAEEIAVEVTMKGTRRLRRAFGEGFRRGLFLPEKGGVKATKVLLMAFVTAWAFAVAWDAVQLMMWALGTSALLFWTLAGVAVLLMAFSPSILRTAKAWFTSEPEVALA